MNLHVSTLGFLTTAFYIVLFGFIWRFVSVKYSDTPVGKAMGYLF